jgi:hypothetical protein
MKIFVFTTLALFVFSSFVYAQQLEVDGNARISGLLDLRASTMDGTSLTIGKDAGINTDFSQFSYNIFIGRSAGIANSIGKHNVFLGYKAGFESDTSDANTFIGNQSALHNLGEHNTFLGFQSGTSNLTGNNNTFLGHKAGNSNTIGSNNIFIGYLSGPFTHGQDVNKAIAIGYNSRVNCSNCVVLGGTGPDSISLGLGTSAPKAQLHVAGRKVRFSRYGHSDRYFQFRTDGSELDLDVINSSLYINTDDTHFVTMGPGNSNVGIGTDAPGGYKLKVQHNTAIPLAVNRINNDGTLIEFLQDGVGEGSIDVSGGIVSYNNFTGSHLAWSPLSFQLGKLVSLTGENERISEDPHAEPVYGIVESTKANDPTVLGAYLGKKESIAGADTKNLHLVMAVGNGNMWVVDNGSDIKIGDYLISSSTRGHAMKDQGEYEVSHIIARAVETVRWAEEKTLFEGKKHKLIAVTFEQFAVRRFEKEISKLKMENAQLKDKLEKIESLLVNLNKAQVP